jgi:hypothetical protein
MNAKTGYLRGESSARLVHGEEFGRDVAQGLRAVVRAAKRNLRHRVVQRAGSHPVALGMVGIRADLADSP